MSIGVSVNDEIGAAVGVASVVAVSVDSVAVSKSGSALKKHVPFLVQSSGRSMIHSADAR
jgi:hypothetical protein